jgi:hypothetical protein
LQKNLRSILITQTRRPTLQKIFHEVERDSAALSASLEAITTLVRTARDHS